MPFGKNSKIKGYIGYYGLTDWWLKTFSEAERHYIEEKYKPMSTGPTDGLLTKITIGSTSQSSSSFLSGLVTWFRKPEDRHIAHRILAKAEIEAQRERDVLGLHFTYRWAIEIYYKDREKVAGALEMSIDACRKQIALSPMAANIFRQQYPNSPLPNHTGFEQLSIILEKKGDYTSVIGLAEQAKQQGWAGDWDKRIERCRKKL